MTGMTDMAGTAKTLVLLDVAIEEFARRLRLVGPGDWRRPTLCTEWDVRALVDHVVGANVRYQLLLHGAPTDRVEATRSVDHLGDDALASFVATADRMVACFHEDGALDRVAHHVIGERSGAELLSMRILDAAIHAWDLARAIGADETLPDDVVAFLLAYSLDLDLGPRQDTFATTSADVSPDASPQDQLLHRLGRHPNTEEIR
ncbi:TIGR03086 family metal-binding protein [Kribbella ginsengisoli]|uniref:TIGR03086 family metal-binding protein n=1 Tax=Kribbella ginsengisoli TaxID=363865 RepID=A0ABP6YVC7_9ACTN